MTRSRSTDARSVEETLAPHVDREWAGDFIVELRLHGVAGDDIGAALAEVDSHCAESGEPAGEAFGDAGEYARSLGLPETEEQATAAVLRRTLPTLVQLAGMLAVITAAPEIAAGQAMSVTAGALVSALVLVAVVLALGLWPEKTLGALAGPRWKAAVAAPLSLALIVAPTILLRQELLAAPAGPSLAAGAVVVLAGVLWDLVLVRREARDPEQDMLLTPWDGAVERDRRRRSIAWAERFRLLMIPAGTAVMAAVLLLFG
ncbi:hypothetical protein GCM10027060_01090 [Nesterenkonia halophila]|uniref:hypothetical protein n=1 Tax=Nesterenkonia halophila TaxID=302044 RepID=UPI0012921ADA|nr:hypothetical protein [Nesterenkonia halophila]